MSAAAKEPVAARPRVALVIPVLRDTEALRELLAAIASWKISPQEILVVAAEPDAELERLCRSGSARLVEAPANRGAQLDRGAREARAEVLWFVHADSVLPVDGVGLLRRALAEGAESGCFAFAFQGPRTATKRLLEGLIALRVRCGGIPYGDQALFTTRDAYEASGGFPHQPLFEEVRLVRCLRWRGTFRVLEARVAVSTRRWDRDGWWRRSLHNRWLAVCHGLGVPAERLAGTYGPFRESGAGAPPPSRIIE